jgi:hypothetical protein
MKMALGQKIFFGYFGTFERYVTNLRDTFVENVKKVQNQPTLVGILDINQKVEPHTEYQINLWSGATSKKIFTSIKRCC